MTTHPFRLTRSLALVVLCAFLLAACDSGGEDSVDASAELSAMFVNLQSALTLAFTPGTAPAAKSAAVLDRRDCPQGGQIDVTSNSGTSIDATIQFLDCNGIDGQLDIDGNSTFTGQTFSFDLTINGELQERCEVNYNSFRETITTDLQGGQPEIVMNGNITADCEGSSVSCSFDDVPLDPNGNNANLFEQNCR